MIRLVALGFTLLCEENTEGKRIVGYEGSDSRLIIPDGIVAIDRKAFLGCQGLKKVVTPQSLVKLGSWSFAQCRNLESITIKASPSEISMERNSFEGCGRVRTLAIGGEELDDMAYLLGAVVNRLPAPYLLNAPELGEESWYRGWDHSLLSYLRTNDHEGFSERILCGEEDISVDEVGSVDGEMPGETESYIRDIRIRKCFLCLLRLMHNTMLSSESKAKIIEYITGNEACWQALKQELGDEVEYFRLYMETLRPDRTEIDRMMVDLGEGHTQAKAFLISYCREGEQNDQVDAGLAMFFDDLMV